MPEPFDWYSEIFAETPADGQIVETAVEPGGKLSVSQAAAVYTGASQSDIPESYWATPSAESFVGPPAPAADVSGQSFLSKAASFLGKILGVGEMMSGGSVPSSSSYFKTPGSPAAAQKAIAKSGVGGLSTGIVLIIVFGIGAMIYFWKGK